MDENRMIQANDVPKFLKGLIAFIKKVLQYFIASLRRYIFVALVVFISLSAIGIIYITTKEPYYESEMTLVYNNMGPFAYGQMLDKLDMLINSKSYKTLASVLKLSEEKVKTIKKITATNISGSALKDDYSTDRSPMYIKVRTTDPSIFTPLQDAILNYLENFSPYQLLRNNINMNIAIKKAEYLNRDVILIDSVLLGYKSFLSNPKSKTDSSSFSDINALLAYKDRLEDKAIAAVEMDPIVLQHTVELYYGFISPDKPTTKNNKLLLWVVLGSFIVSCFTCVLVRLSYS